MRILALELSGGQGSIAWIENDREPVVRFFANNRKHSGLFFENLQLCSREFGAPNQKSSTSTKSARSCASMT